ncbi:uncharacterized protein LOC122176995 [Lagopus leucura]|uniref:uncharacterized protein LOC122176995 n=1 Tax=Lagopus leucura TaxID=30410 RepID=UPI001C6767DA|nr:uncharacterized protein LOC122176995 [Lagopus leucura]
MVHLYTLLRAAEENQNGVMAPYSFLDRALSQVMYPRRAPDWFPSQSSTLPACSAFPWSILEPVQKKKPAWLGDGWRWIQGGFVQNRAAEEPSPMGSKVGTEHVALRDTTGSSASVQGHCPLCCKRQIPSKGRELRDASCAAEMGPTRTILVLPAKDALGPGMLPAEQRGEAAPGRGQERARPHSPPRCHKTGAGSRLGFTLSPPALPNRNIPH